jgi:methyl-accepting chemotaxis protein
MEESLISRGGGEVKETRSRADMGSDIIGFGGSQAATGLGAVSKLATLMRKLTISQRIAAVGCLVLMTVAVSLFYFISKGFSKDIAFASLERSGLRYQRPLGELLAALSEHQSAALAAGGPAAAPDVAAAAEARVDAALLALQAVDSELGPVLQFTPEGLAKRGRAHFSRQTLSGEWGSLKAGSASQWAGTSGKAHAHLISDVRSMIAHVADTSNLTLDPDLDSYYLMDAALVALPQAQERLAGIETLGREALAKGDAGMDQRLPIAAAAELLKQIDEQRSGEDVRTAVKEDENFNGVSASMQANLPPLAERHQAATGALLGMLGRITASGGGLVSERDFAAAVAGARAAASNLQAASAGELDILLRKRMDDLGRSRLWALALTALGLAASFGIATRVLRSTVKSLAGMSEHLLTQSAQLAAASEQIGSTSQQLAAGATEQASSLEETAASSEEISSMAATNSQHARGAADLVSASHDKFAQANMALDQMVTAMGEINEESNRISKVIKVIDGIAFQTNILALNAAVEAARAGEAGMGFAVVAEEVRNLAQRCAEAARETAALIEGSIAKSREGQERVSQVTVAFRTITDDSARVRELVEQVHATSQEQTRGVKHVAKALALMESVTQKNAASAEESAAAVEELNAQSATLKDIVGQLNALVGAAAAER